MGALVARLLGRPRLVPARIKAVWNSYISSHPDYFHKVIRNVCARDAAVKEVLLQKAHIANDDEADFVLQQIANRIFAFFHSLIMEDKVLNAGELKKACYALGRQHAAFSSDSFKDSKEGRAKAGDKKRLQVVYWDEFTLAFLEELETTGRIDRRDLRAWQALLHTVNENMLAGYHDARSASEHSQ